MIFVYLIIVALIFGALGFFTAAFMSGAGHDNAFRAGYSAGLLTAAKDPAEAPAAELLADLENYGGTQ